MISERTTTIGRLLVRADVATAAGAEQRAGSALRALDLRPPAMPPQAILCIRSLADPMPHSLDLRSSAARPATEWETATRHATADLFRRAVRPVRGPVRDDAEAVLFADRAELLLCAARDALRGLLASHWWWLHLLRSLSLDGVVREWRSEPAYIPAAMELLAASREAVAFARRLDPSMAMQLALATLQAYGHDALAHELAAMATTPTTTPIGGPSVRDASPRTIAGEVRPVQDTGASAPMTPSLFAPFLREALATEAAAVEQRLFLIVALTLRRAPSLLRRGDSAVAFSQWLREIRGEPTIGAAEEIRKERRPSEWRRPASTSTLVQRDAALSFAKPAPDIAPASITTRAPDGGRPEAAEPPTRCLPSPVMPSADAPPARPEISEQPSRQEVDDPAPAPPIKETASFDDLPRAAAAEPQRAGLTEAALHSQVAGTFFLLNAAIALGYYSDFTARNQEGCLLDPWHFLALVGRTLLDPDDDLDADPIWPLLAALAGDATADVEPMQLEEMTWEIDRYVSSALGDWSADLKGVAGQEASALLLRPGRIVLTPAHLDVHFNLPDHPIAIRLSGLDRDPGWIPAAGRHVAFHFD
jgi:hypothetical protein